MYILQVILAYLLADFIMGVYHWIKDTYFSPFTPIIGKTFIWSSRLHHVKPRYVLEFSNSQLFLSSALWTSSWILPLTYFTGLNIFNVVLFLTISINDIVHKYSHATNSETPAIINFLQSAHVIQDHSQHYLHHVCPHDINYCPITPYVNPVLEYFNFWRKLEKIIGLHLINKDVAFVDDPTYPAGIKFLDNIVISEKLCD